MKTFEVKNDAVIEVKKLMKKHGISALDISLYTMIYAPRLSEVLNGKRRITPDTDLRLSTFFKLKPGHFLKLQIDYDIKMKENEIGNFIDKIKNIDEILKA